MSDVRDIPAGFVPLPDPEGVHSLNIVPADQLRSGAVVIYRGTHEWKGSSGQPHRAHAFDDENGSFGLWASAQLDRHLKQLQPGTRLYLRYDGLVPHPALPGRSTHRWVVAAAPSDLPAANRSA